MAWLLSPNQDTRPAPKLHITTGYLPPYMDPLHPPTKKSPWRQISQSPYLSSINIILPSLLYSKIWPQVTSHFPDPVYSTLFLKLSDILTGPFFTTYIKTPKSNIILLSEGIPGADNLYSLCNGVLRLDLGKEDYQRAGLQGKPIQHSGARKYGKERWRVEIDLRSPSMVKGKKGFDRLLYACNNALDESREWRFRDLGGLRDKSRAAGVDGAPGEGGKDDNDTSMQDLSELPSTTENETVGDPLASHHPQIFKMVPETKDLENILVPPILSSSPSQKPLGVANQASIPLEHADDYYDLNEWVDLVALSSPRVRADDNPDPYISRYSIPGYAGPSGEDTLDEDRVTKGQELKVITWKGFLDREWVVKLLTTIIKYSRTPSATSSNSKDAGDLDLAHQWLTLTITTHHLEAVGEIDGYTIILRPDIPSTTATPSDTNATHEATTPTLDDDNNDEKITEDSRDDPDIMQVDSSNADDADSPASKAPTTTTLKRKRAQSSSDTQPESPSNNNPNTNTIAEKEHITTTKKGFQTFTCFQFVDSLASF